jgi:putative glutamine transport system permease protein
MMYPILTAGLEINPSLNGPAGAVRAFFSAIHGYEGALARGLWVTVRISLLAFVLSIAGGTLIALLRTAPLWPLRSAGAAYVELVRNIPLLVIIVFLFFGMPKVGVVMSGFKAGVIGLGLYTTAYTGEAIRAGILAIDRGQAEAARSLGMSSVKALRHVVLPQAFTVVLPPLGNLTIAMVKNSAVVATIGVADITLTTDKLVNSTARTLEFLSAAIVLYLLLTLPLAYLTRALERRAARASQ